MKGKSKSEKSKAEISWDNLCAYSYDQAKQVAKLEGEENCIAFMQAFINEAHSAGIRGHASGSKGSKQNKQTSGDLEAFAQWFEEKKAEIKEESKGKGKGKGKKR